MNPSASSAPVETTPETVDQLVARVLRRGHQKAEGLDRPDAARVVLYLSELFADELATADPRFDRLQFIKHVTEEPS